MCDVGEDREGLSLYLFPPSLSSVKASSILSLLTPLCPPVVVVEVAPVVVVGVHVVERDVGVVVLCGEREDCVREDCAREDCAREGCGAREGVVLGWEDTGFGAWALPAYSITRALSPTSSTILGFLAQFHSDLLLSA